MMSWEREEPEEPEEGEEERKMERAEDSSESDFEKWSWARWLRDHLEEEEHFSPESNCSDEGWDPVSSPENPEELRQELWKMGSIEREQLDVFFEEAREFVPEFAAVLFSSMPPGAFKVRRLNLWTSIYDECEGFGVRNAGAAALARELEANTTITELNLNTSNFSEAVVCSLAGALRVNTTLKWLNLGQIPGPRYDMSDAGLIALAEALAANVTLERLRLTYVGFESSIVGVRALLGAVVAHPSLTALSFADVFCLPDGVQAICEMLQATRSLRRLCLCVTDLEEFEPEQVEAGAIAIAAAIPHATSLTHLNLACCEYLRDEGVVALAKLLSLDSCALVSVDLSHNNIGAGAGAAAIAGALLVNRSLTRLDVSRNTSMFDEGGALLVIEALKTNRTLTALGMSSCKLQGAMSALAEALEANHTLTALNISDNNTLESDGVFALAAALASPDCSLEALNIGGCQSEDEAAWRALTDALTSSTTLTTIRAGEDSWEEVCGVFSRNRRQREASAAQREFLRSPAGLDAVPWIEADVLVNVVAEYAGKRWTEDEMERHRLTGSYFKHHAGLREYDSPWLEDDMLTK